MAKPLTVVVYDTFDSSYHFDWATESLELGGDVKKPLKVKYKLHKSRNAFAQTDLFEQTHGLKVAKTFLMTLDEQNPVEVNMIFAQMPEYRGITNSEYLKKNFKPGGDLKAKDLDEFNKLPLAERARYYGPSRHLDGIITKYKPDIVLSSIWWGSAARATERRNYGKPSSKYKKVLTPTESFEALSAYRKVPIVMALDNSKEDKRVVGSALDLEMRNSGFIVVGHNQYVKAFNKTFINKPGVIESFLHDPKIRVNLPFVPNYKKLKRYTNASGLPSLIEDKPTPTEELRHGNSFVAPLFAGIAMNVILQKNKTLSSQAGFSMSSKLFMIQYIKDLKRRQAKYGLKNPVQLVDTLHALEDYMTNAYVLAAKARGSDFDPKSIPDQQLIDNTFNLAPLAK